MKSLTGLMLRGCAFLLALATTSANAAEPITVFAAASLKESMDAAATQYEQRTGTPVRVSYAASSALARQIEQGAPADVFFSADLEWMDYLAQRGRVDTASRHNLLGNTLVVVAPKSSKTSVDLRKAGSLKTALGSGRLAMGQVSSVPAGKYGKAALESLQLWDGVSTQLAESDSVRAALLLVSRGEAPLGIVYGSDAKADPKVRVVATFPADSHPPIVYPVAALKGAQPGAEAFVRWLISPAARPIFIQRGFTVQP
ncbi:molybdate ABC transporter substrate-binding protein [Pseudoxanthomonas composti]|uniref:Molybdate ABC transporter substrate-binding protein n=1 Tax=Pseudoxanthomonas composti TaxID=2137479 RepID=A0A4Q1JU70_9GAMM|nr:molybdate ABC transporter substrate-binding protein [Pseudoxanthomonas composti]